MKHSNQKNQISPLSIYRRILKNRKTRIGMMILYIGLLMFMMNTLFKFKYYSYEEILEMALNLFPFILIIIGTGYFLLGYLEGSKFTSPPRDNLKTSNDDSDQLKNKFRNYLDEFIHYQQIDNQKTRDLLEIIQQQFIKQNELQLDENQRNELFNSIKQSFSENINDDFFKQLNENIYSELTTEKRNRLELLLKDFHAIRIRLDNEIFHLSRKSNVNLVIGSLTTIVAFIALGFVVFQNSEPFISFPVMLYHYIPRLSLIIFIEVFAYFFLRLYKLNLDDMKYFQNELTTVELKLVSITTAINFGKDIDISAIAIELSKTERNFILKKGETTVEIEKSRIDKIDLKQILKSITDITNKMKIT